MVRTRPVIAQTVTYVPAHRHTRTHTCTLRSEDAETMYRDWQ